MEQLKVVIADDHPIVLLGVRELVERDHRFCVVGEAVCSQGLIDLLEKQPVDLVISDYNMPANSPYGDGLKLVTYLKRHYPAVRILVLTMISNPLILTQLSEIGVDGIVQKNQMHGEIENALNAIATNSTYRAMFNDSSESKAQAVDLRFGALSPKEFEIIRLFATGQTVSDIARNLNRSKKTISTQKVSAMRKLGVSSDQDLIAYCIECNIFG
ncbi:response regulator [Pseudomonas sp. CK-NBRI-02]|uniref:response regulator n=1 Tax=Pseudomonas sp. CK-NBRI-02 TaxID=2249759 RepID=UPI0005B9F63A|nr:response regulator [Pseudomonas sp. CK-NBRI-02]TYO70642.1 response regulator [Pseudomonas sp. CK-NBRI-02]